MYLFHLFYPISLLLTYFSKEPLKEKAYKGNIDPHLNAETPH